MSDKKVYDLVRNEAGHTTEARGSFEHLRDAIALTSREQLWEE